MSAGHGLDVSVFGHSNGNGYDHNGSLHKVSSLANMGNGIGEDDDDLTFDSPKEEAAYYRDKYRVAVDLLNETRAELDEFQVSSRELEQELEKELEATEARQADLRDRIQRLENEKEEWRTKFVNLQKMHSSTTAAMQREMDNLRSERDKALVAVRDLEMGNDQLERNERVASSSLLDMEIKYNRAIEEKTLLEQEVIQKQELEEECQRLKDDVRDANNEISILRDQLARAVVPTPPSSNAPLSPAPTRSLHSRATSRTDSRSDASSPTPTDRSTTGRPSTVTPRKARVTVSSPKNILSASTATITASPTARRAVSGIPSSPSSIPALARSTATRPFPSQPSRRVTTSGPMRPQSSASQTTKTKGFRLLHDLQARIKTTDDKIGKMVKKGPSGFSRRQPTSSNASSNPPSTTPTAAPALSASTTLRARTKSRVRAANFSMTPSVPPPPPAHAVTPGPNDEIGFLSPTSWVLLSDPEETPPPNGVGKVRAVTPGSPLDKPKLGASTARSRGLPSRPSIPSPLVRETKARHGHMGSDMKGKHGLSASTMVTSDRARVPRAPLSVSTARPPSRGHVRASSNIPTGSRSGATSPSMIPAPRRLSIGPGAIDFSSPPLPSPRLHSRPPSRGAAGIGPRSHTPTAGRHTPSASMSGIPPPPVPPRRVPRRSSMGVDETGAPPSAIPAPKSRMSTSANTLPRAVSAALRESRSEAP